MSPPMSDAAPAGEFLLEMRGINKSFPGVKALDNAQLKVRPHSVHALMGENGAGKSTLLKCLFGIYHADAGEILFCGRPVAYRTSKEALENGISMVHQELNLVPQVSVMDNLWLGRYPQKGPFIDHAKMYRDTKAIFDELGIDVDPRQKVADLTVSQMQMIEIAKAFSYNAKIVIMDEPTSSLSEKEVNHLFGIIEKLRAVDTTGVEPMTHAGHVGQRLRDDVVTESDHRAENQRSAPSVADGLYLVPRVVE